MVIDLNINFSDCPRTLARSGLGWGPLEVAYAKSRGMVYWNVGVTL